MSDTTIRASAVRDNGDGTFRVEAGGKPYVLDLRRAKWSASPRPVLDMGSGAGRLVKAVLDKRAALDDPRSLIAEQIREAGQTLRSDKMPADVVNLGKMNCALPDHVRSQEELIDAQRERDARKGGAGGTSTPPTSEQIDRLHQVLDWMLWVRADLDEDHRLVMAGKLYGYGLRRIASNHPTYANKDAVGRAWTRTVDLILSRMDVGGN